MSAQTFEKIEQLVEQINSLHAKVKSGNASLEDVNAFQETINKLYERATWLKYKAIESNLGKKDNDFTSKMVLDQEDEASFDENTQNKMVVDDEESSSINEDLTKDIVEKPIAPKVDKQQEPEERPAIDFTTAFSDRKEEPKAANVFSEEKEKSAPEPVVQDTPEPEAQTSLLDAIGTDDKSINDALMEDEDNSLASKMQKSPITDITSSIGMNDRFSFINDLFQEDGAAYNSAVELLNKLDNKVQAKEKLSDYAIEYSWDLESKSVRTFVELVERRYS